MSKVLHAGTICWFSSLGNYPTETGSETSSARLLRSSQHSIIWALVKVLRAVILARPMRFVSFASFRSLQTAWWLLPARSGTALRAFSIITDASLHDSKAMDLIPYEKDSFYIFDRAYMVTEMLYHIHKTKAFFVVREKHKMVFKVVEDKSYNNPETGVMADQIIMFTGNKTKKNYPEVLRRVVFYDKEGNRTFVFYTNNTEIMAEEVALLYKFRWRCELFFKWLKQHLRVKEFYGTSENAVKIQIYAAIIAYCLVAIIQSELKLEMDTYDVLRILNVSLFVKMPLTDLLTKAGIAEIEDKRYVQLQLEFKD